MSPGRVYGWLGLLDKIGAEAFSEEDERLAGILAAQVGRIYQNGSLYADALNHASELEREIGERKRAEHRQAILLKVGQILAQAAAFAMRARGVLHAICSSLGWELGEVWLVDPSASVLQRVETWQNESTNYAEWMERTREVTFAPGTGLLGRVWHGKQSAWIADVTKDTNFPRRSCR